MVYDKNMNLETTNQQQEYVEEQESKKNGLGLVFADAFLRGMRDIGYKSPAWALSEMTDNSIQAQASTIEIVFGEMVSERGGEQPQQMAIVDDGVGMIPKMISYAVRWGGTDREDDRRGFGRYGYGLPSSAVSIAKRYSVYSKHRDGDWNRVIVDIEELAPIAGDIDAIDALLAPVQADPPEWVGEATTKIDPATQESGTIVVLEQMDRLGVKSGWKAARALKSKLLEHFGLIYRHWIPEPQIIIDGESVQPVDPLFLLENGRFFDETEVMAKPVEARSFTVVTSGGGEGTVTIRASYLPPNFQLVDPGNYTGQGSDKKNSRFKIMKANNGLHVCRDGREIDCVSPTWTTFTIYDRNVKIEIDFSPELDEFFGITTTKQQIVIDEEMWDRLLNRANLKELVTDVRRQVKADGKMLKAAAEQAKEGEDRPSERAMRESKPFDTHAKGPTDRQKEQGDKNLEREVIRLSEMERSSREEVFKRLESETHDHPFRVEFHAIPEGPFYRPTRLGNQKQIIINTDHPFYEKVYSLAPEIRAGLEVLLFVLAEGELEATDDAEIFYKAERQYWSERLRHALDSLADDESILDAAAAVEAESEMEMSAEGSTE